MDVVVYIPTYYHFVGSILVLYIPYYFMLKIDWIRNHISFMIGIIFITYVACYILVYDKSYYHIDTVREPMIRFLFMEAMLLGTWFRLNDEKLRNRGRALLYALGTVIVFFGYFACKILLLGGGTAQYQILNQIIIFVLLYFVFRWFISIDRYIEKAPGWIDKFVGIVANLTLEIYLVQYILIEVIKNTQVLFPLNWLLLTALIVVSAFVLHMIVEIGRKQVTELIMKEN